MLFSLRNALLLLAASAVAAGACGGNVVVDGPPADTGAGTGAAGGGTTTGFGASGTTTGFGASGTTTGTGFGASGTTTGTGFGASGTTTGTGFGASTTVSVSVSSAVSSTGTGVGGGACSDGLDEKLLGNEPIYPVMVQCAQQNLGNPAGETMCITSQTGGLSAGCVSCVVDDLQCSLMKCLGPCSGNPNGMGCLDCRANNCAAPWVACSGIVEAPGSTTCNIELAAGTTGMGWQRGLPEEAFVTPVGYETYQGLDACACGGTAGGCTNLCGAMGPPDFCTGFVASPPCLMCLQGTCGAELMKCEAN